MTKVKATRGEVTKLAEASSTLSSHATNGKNFLDDFVESVNTAADSWKSNEDYISKWIETAKTEVGEGNTDYGYYITDEHGQGPWQWNSEKIKTKAKELLSAECDKLKGWTSDMSSWDPVTPASELDEKLQKIDPAIEAFEGTTPNLDEALKSLKDDGVDVTIGTDKVTGKTMDENGEYKDYEYDAYVVDVNGDKIPISEAVNAAYTEYGTATNAAVAYASATNEENWSDEDLNTLLGNIHNNLSSLVGTGMYNVASKEDQDGLYKELRKKGWPVSLEDLAAKLGEGDSGVWGALDLGEYGKYLTGLTGADGDDNARNLALTTLGLAVGLGKGFNKDDASPKSEQPEDTDKDKEKEEKSWPEETNPGGTNPGGSNNDGSNNGGGGKFKTPDTEVDKDKSDKGEKGDDKTPDLTDRIKDKLPSPLTEIKKDYDALAREKFDEQFKTEEEYAEYVMKVNEEFESLTPEQLSGKLKEYGYDESVIQYLLQPENKDVAATAYASGKLNADLTTRANELAKADNVKDFDTKYDDPIDRTNDNESDTSSYAYLRDGDLNANVSPVNYNKDVKAAKETWTKSQETYTTAATKANAAIEKANSQAAELEKLQKQYGKDTSKWKEAEIKKYNETVDKYNKAVTEAISANKEATTAKASMDKAQEAYTKQYNDYQDKIKKEARDAYAQGRQNNNNNGNPSDSSDASNVTDTTPTGEIDPVTINSDGSISI